MTKEEIQTMANKIGEVAPQLAAQFIANPDNFDYSQLEHYSKFTDKYKSVADFIGDKASIKANIWKQLEGQFPSDARFQSLQQEYPWLSKEELKEWFDKSAAYQAEYEAERKANADRKRREQEVAGTYKDWHDPTDKEGRNWGFWRNVLASDYEKQRYIDAPNEAIFGYSAPGFIGSSAGAKADLAAGIAGGVADVAPLPFGAQIWAGPAIRTARDVAHKASDSPYQKDWSDVGLDAAKDVGFNFGSAFLANARRGQRIASLAADPKVGQALALADETKNIREGAEAVMQKMYKGAAYATDDKALYEAISSMPDSELKQELLKEAAVFGTERPINREEIGKLINKYMLMSNPGLQRIDKLSIAQGKPYQVLQPYNTPFNKLAKTAPTFEELSLKQKAMYGANRAAEAANKGKLGQSFFQGANTARGRGNQPNIVETALRQQEREATINRLISSYSLMWNKNNPPPEAKDSPLIKEAWEKWAGK